MANVVAGFLLSLITPTIQLSLFQNPTTVEVIAFQIKKNGRRNKKGDDVVYFLGSTYEVFTYMHMG